MTVPSASKNHGTRRLVRASVLVTGVFAVIVWGSQAAQALDPRDATAEIRAAAPVEEAADAATPVAETVEQEAPVEQAAPAVERVVEPVTDVVEQAAPAAERVVEPVTDVVEQAAPAVDELVRAVPVAELTEAVAPVTQVVEDLAPIGGAVDYAVTDLIDGTVGPVTSGGTLPMSPVASGPLLQTEETTSALFEPGIPEAERRPWQTARSLVSLIVGQPWSSVGGIIAPAAGSRSANEPDVPGPGRVSWETPLADWGGILETGGRGLSQVAAYLSVAILLALGISRWFRPIAYARVPNPFLSSIELPG